MLLLTGDPLVRSKWVTQHLQNKSGLIYHVRTGDSAISIPGSLKYVEPNAYEVYMRLLGKAGVPLTGILNALELPAVVLLECNDWVGARAVRNLRIAARRASVEIIIISAEAPPGACRSQIDTILHFAPNGDVSTIKPYPRKNDEIQNN